MDQVVTVWMHQDQVGGVVGTPIDPSRDVMDMPARPARDLCLTDRAEPFLIQPQSQQAPAPRQLAYHLEAQTGLEVGFPFGIERIGIAFDHAMASNLYLAGECQRRYDT